MNPPVRSRADREALIAGVDEVLQQAKALERGTPVMLDVKSATGNFFYTADPLGFDSVHIKIKHPTLSDGMFYFGRGGRSRTLFDGFGDRC